MPRSLPSNSWRSRLLCGSLAVVFACCAPVAFAWSWNTSPQPLLQGNQAIWSDSNSPLAWDQSARILWHLSDGALRGAFWSGNTFVVRAVDAPAPDAHAGLLADPGLHFLYFVDASGQLQCLRPIQGAWRTRIVSDLPVSRLLAVDARRHTVFAYAAATGSIYSFAFTASAKGWTAATIATGLGNAEEAGAFDSRGRVLYTTHESADSTVPRHPDARTLPDPTGIGLWKPWPLVATAWDATTGAWSSQVLDETGVPQQPAVRLTDRRVFYAERDAPDLVSYLVPATTQRVETRGTLAGWSGRDTFVDHHHYKIRAPDYPPPWSGGVIVTTNSPHAGVLLHGPISVVPYFEAVWTDTPLPARLTRFRALIDARQNRLLQHRTIASGESVRQQTGQVLAGYLYQDKDGLLASAGGSNFYFHPSGTIAEIYPKLDATFDPANPPANFQDLASPSLLFQAYRENTSRATAADADKLGLPTSLTLDPQATWIAPYLRLPYFVTTRNFGHNYASKALNQVGGRYRYFFNASTNLAASSQLAVDDETGASFYTQSTEPPDTTFLPTPFAGFDPAAFTSFHREPELKFTDYGQRVWIVLVY